MHFHAEHSLFFERRQSLWQSGLSLGLTVSMLILNAGADSITVSGIGAGLGSLLLVHGYIRGHRRIEPVIAWSILLIGFVLLGGVALNADVQTVLGVAARILCGVIWILWLGTQTDWASLRQLLLKLRIPETIVSTLDHSIMHGVLTQREWISRRNAARMRIGTTRLSLKSWASLLSEGALQSFVRLEHMEENALIRCSPLTQSSEQVPIELDAVSVKRGEHLVLEQVSLKIQSTEWVLVCGPSGAGKSSLLRLLAGLDGPSEGIMNRLGKSVSSDSKLETRLDGRIALLTQNPEHHFIASTVAEDIAWGLLQRGVNAREAQEHAREMANAMGIDHLLTRACHDLSFGEQRRVALAGLLVLKPSLLLLDEPTAGLDPMAAQELRTLVQTQVEKHGSACVWATHDLHTYPPMAKRVILLRAGQVIFDGPTSEGLSSPWMKRAGLALTHGDE
ncbi:MAG: ATP-binding cassette domain-containing protein [Myxococcota bacterium]|nr:ATP-binding cassette domain-containing protein [Myxococcota bacterium]